MRLLSVTGSLFAVSTTLVLFAGCASMPSAQPAVAPEVVARTIPVDEADKDYTLPAPAEGEEWPDPSSPPFAWIERGESLSLTTWGSGSCPSVPESIDVVSAGRIVVNIDDSVPTQCTMDLSPHTSKIELPDDVDALPLTISFNKSQLSGVEESPEYVLE